MRLFPTIRATVGILLLVPFLSGCGLVFVKGPPVGWQEIEDADELEISAITQPCTNSKTMVWLDGVGAVLMISNAIYAADAASELGGEAYRANAVGNGVGAVLTVVGAVVGIQKVNECREFNAHLLELRRGDPVGQATYKWSDQFSPVPDFGVASQNLPAIISPGSGFSPVFSGSIRNSPEHLEGRGKKKPKPQQPQEPPTQPAR